MLIEHRTIPCTFEYCMYQEAPPNLGRVHASDKLISTCTEWCKR